MGKGKSRLTEKELQIRRRRRDSLFQLLRYILRYKWRLLAVVIAVIAANLLALLIPALTGQIVDVLSEGVSKGSVDFAAVGRGALGIAAVAVVSWGLSALQNVMMVKTAQNMVLDLRHDVFSKLMKLPVSYFDTNTKGNIISIVSVDIDNISETVSADAITLITGAVTVIGSLAMMLFISPMLSVIFVVTVPLMCIIARVISKRARRLFREKKNCFGRLCGYAEEMITAQKTIKVYGLEEYNKNNFFEISRELREKGSQAEFVSSSMMPSMNGINNLNFTLICALGAVLALSGKISVGDISAFVLYSKKFSAPIVDTANIINMLQSSLAACDRVFSILNADAEPDEALPENIPPRVKGDIRLEDVCFSYVPEKPVLKHVDFQVKPGQKVAIVGATGSGKTTIISLLLRFYDVNSGRITLDGKDIREYPLQELRRNFALVLQDSWLFEGSVYENIGYAAPPERSTPEKIRELCAQIEVDDFIKTLPDGYDSILHNDSGGLSQGQKQLLNIARAFLCDPPIFILDEATSSVDTQTEAKIQLVTDKVIEGKTSIIIAHRLSTILSADCILVMKDGEIRETGTHAELLKKGGLYKDLYESQFLTGEPEN